MKREDITHYFEPTEGYTKGLDAAETLKDLRIFLKSWELIAWDAYDAALAMDDLDFKTFRILLKAERRNKSKIKPGPNGELTPVEEKTVAILIPGLMMFVTLVADHFKVPWGLAFNRCVDTGKIAIDAGRARRIDSEDRD